MVLKKLLKETLDMCILELKKEKTKKNILTPIVDTILEKISPYIWGMCLFFITMIILIICILYLIISK